MDTGIKLVLSQVILDSYVIQYPYTYQYHIPRLHLIFPSAPKNPFHLVFKATIVIVSKAIPYGV
jgi:hypothetical protein